MNDQETRELKAEIEQRFPGLELNVRVDVSADVETRTFRENGTIGVWYNSNVVCVIRSREHYEAFLAVVCLVADKIWEEDKQDRAKAWDMSQGTYTFAKKSPDGEYTYYPESDEVC